MSRLAQLISRDPDGIGIPSPALEGQLQAYGSDGLNVRDVVEKFAPQSQNDTGQYLEFVCHELGIGPDALVSDALRIEGLL